MLFILKRVIAFSWSKSHGNVSPRILKKEKTLKRIAARLRASILHGLYHVLYDSINFSTKLYTLSFNRKFTTLKHSKNKPKR